MFTKLVLFPLLLCAAPLAMAAGCNEQSGQGCNMASVLSQKAQPLQKAWSERKFDGIDRTLRDWCGEGSRLPDGQPELVAFEAAFDNHFRTAQSWEADRQALAQWSRQAPDSLAAAVVEALYWRAYASQLRLGAMDKMPREALDMYHEQIARGSSRLWQVKSQSNNCPLWHSLQIGMLLEGGVPRSTVAKAYLEAVQAFPNDPQIHIAMARAYSPRWGGSAVQFDQFARRAAHLARGSEGAAMYARLYWKEDGNGGDALRFGERKGLPDWQLVKNGFEEILQRYPHDTWNRNKFASFACRANDRDTYLKLRQELGERIYPELWPDVSGVDSCDRKWGKATATAANGLPAH